MFSQMGHIPFNALMLPMLSNWSEPWSDTLQLVGTSLFLGLSAGIFEESARYLTYRFWVRGRYQWSRGIMLGLGHGGAEAIILGILTGINIGYLIGFRMGYFKSIVPSGTELQILQLADTLYSVPIYQTLLGALERFFAIILHIVFSLTVLQTFIRKNQWWFIAAIALHAFVDAVVVWSSVTFGVEISELIIGIMAFIGLFLIYQLRTFNEPLPVQEPLPDTNEITKISVELSREELDESRYL